VAYSLGWGEVGVTGASYDIIKSCRAEVGWSSGCSFKIAVMIGFGAKPFDGASTFILVIAVGEVEDTNSVVVDVTVTSAFIVGTADLTASVCSVMRLFVLSSLKSYDSSVVDLVLVCFSVGVAFVILGVFDLLTFEIFSIVRPASLFPDVLPLPVTLFALSALVIYNVVM
jgi:hypothetical protein